MHNEFFSAVKNEIVLCPRLEIIMLRKLSQTQKDKCAFIYGSLYYIDM